MPWIQVTLEIPDSKQLETYENALLALGALSVTLQDAADQPILEPELGDMPVWDKTRITGLFEATVDPARLEASLRQQFGDSAMGHFSADPLEDREWTRAWMDNFKPMNFGQRLWICPEGFDIPDPEATNLMLDPGLAFGTGTHPTTSMCLQWLDSHDISNKTVIDFGCGSGVLAIAALLLGARQATATDNDPQALQATKDNARKNHVEERISIHLPGTMPTDPVDLLLANILAGPLQQLAPQMASLVRPGGQIVLSGILDSQADEMLQCYGQWFNMKEPARQEEWIRLEGTRK